MVGFDRLSKWMNLLVAYSMITRTTIPLIMLPRSEVIFVRPLILNPGTGREKRSKEARRLVRVNLVQSCLFTFIFISNKSNLTKDGIKN